MTSITQTTTLLHSNIRSLKLVHRGKVRDSYAVDDEHLLIVASDRLSAFDVVMPTPVPDKGRILTDISNFWFQRTLHITPNHLTDIALEDVLFDPQELAQARGRSVVVKRLKPIPAEAVVRGYLIGSGWKDYQASGQVCGIELSPGLQLAEKLGQTIFTPATKAAVGDHDQNITFESLRNLVGQDYAQQMRDTSLALYQHSLEFAAHKGIIIADTKFEFGLNSNGDMILMDEVLTPDSSRFWPASCYAVGISPPSYDKQFVRDYLDTLDWDKTPPAPAIPQNVLDKTVDKYREARDRLLG